ncbi:MAG TPA: hypothetical protein VFT78_10245 [Hanamia sp.]|nr:hypothetical protein [Hanamia sp.]
MKKETNEDPFATRCWYYDIIIDPMQVLAAVYVHAELYYYLKMIRKVLQYADAEKLFKKSSPCDVILYMKIICSLIRVSHSLQEIKASPISVSENDAFNKTYYRSHLVSSSDWKDFPRYLSIEEYCNPYRALRKVFSYQNMDRWLYLWTEAVENALSEHSGGEEFERIRVFLLLNKLVEATHLINVREVNHIGGRMKNRVVNVKM